MKRTIRLELSRSLFFAAASLWIVLQSSAAQATCGKFEVVKGDVQRLSAQQKSGSGSALAPVQAGASVCSGDTVQTGPSSRAKIQMEDGNVLNLSPDSKIVIEKYEFKPAENKKKVMLNVVYGKLRTATQRENMYSDTDKNGDQNTFKVKTKSAVAGVRGTDFLTSFDLKTAKSEIVTFKGIVEVAMVSPQGALSSPVQVVAGQRTEVATGQAPLPPISVPKKEIEKLGTESSAATAPPADSKGSARDASPANSTDSASASPRPRDPASAPPASQGSMIDMSDLGRAPAAVGTANGIGPSGGPGGGLPVPPQFLPAALQPGLLPPPLPVCDFCNQQIQTGPSRVNIVIRN